MRKSSPDFRVKLLQTSHLALQTSSSTQNNETNDLTQPSIGCNESFILAHVIFRPIRRSVTELRYPTTLHNSSKMLINWFKIDWPFFFLVNSEHRTDLDFAQISKNNPKALYPCYKEDLNHWMFQNNSQNLDQLKCTGRMSYNKLLLLLCSSFMPIVNSFGHVRTVS